MAALGVEPRPTERWIRKLFTTSPSVLDDSRQRLELNGASRFVVGAPTELPRQLSGDLRRDGWLAAVDEFERVGQLVDCWLATEGVAEEVDEAADFGDGG